MISLEPIYVSHIPVKPEPISGQKYFLWIPKKNKPFSNTWNKDLRATINPYSKLKILQIKMQQPSCERGVFWEILSKF